MGSKFSSPGKDIDRSKPEAVQVHVSPWDWLRLSGALHRVSSIRVIQIAEKCGQGMGLSVACGADFEETRLRQIDEAGKLHPDGLPKKSSRLETGLGHTCLLTATLLFLVVALGCVAESGIDVKVKSGAQIQPQSGIISSKPMQSVEMPGIASVGLPAGAVRDDAILTLEESSLPVPEGARLIGQTVRMRIRSATGTPIERTSIRDDIVVTLNGGVAELAQENLAVLMVIDSGKTSERRVAAYKVDLSVGTTSSGNSSVVLRMRDTDAILALALFESKGPTGFGVFVPPPLNPIELSGKLGSDGVLKTQWNAPPQGASGYRLIVRKSSENPPDDCSGPESASTNETAYAVSGLALPYAYVIRVCSANTLTPPDLSRGVVTTVVGSEGNSAGKSQTPTTATAINALLGGVPGDPSSDQNLRVKVFGGGVAEYQYAVLRGASDCGTATYAAWRRAADPILDSLGADGQLLLCVRARDASGHEQQSPTAYGWFKDSTSPTFVGLALNGPAATGFLNLAASQALPVDLVQPPIASGFEQAAYTVARADVACASLSPRASVIPRTNDALITTDGTYHVCVKLTDAAGNITYGSSSEFMVDRTPPSFVSLPLADALSDGYINAAKHDMASPLTKDLMAAGHEMVGYKLTSAGTDCSTITGYGFTVPMFNSSSLTIDGSYKICVRLSDSANNPSAFGSSASFVYDSQPPIFASVSLVNDAIDGTITPSERNSSNDLIGPIVASGQSSIAYRLVRSAETCDDSVTYKNSAPKSSSSDFSADGDYKVCLRLADAAGNISYSSSGTMTLVTPPPGFSPTTSLDNTPSDPSNAASINIKVSGQSVVQYRYALLDSAGGCGGAVYGGWISVSNRITGSLGADGPKTLCVIGRDSSNIEQSVPTLVAWVKDTTPPAFSSVALVHAAADGRINSSERDAGLSVVGAVVASEYDSVQYELTLSTTVCNGALPYTPSPPTANSAGFGSDGLYKICVRLADLAGNITFGVSTAIQLKTTAPSFTSIALINGAIDGSISGVDSVSSDFMVGTPVGQGYDTAQFSLVSSTTTCDASLSYGAQPRLNSANMATDGTYKVCVKLIDNVGNAAAYGESTSVIRDTAPPTFTSISLATDAADGYINATEFDLASPMVQNLIGSGFLDVKYKLVLGSQDCDASVSYGTNIPTSNSSDFGSDGSYRVCVRLADHAGNLAFGSSPSITLHKVAPSFTSVVLIQDADDGYLTFAESNTSNNLVGNLVGASYDTVEYKITLVGTACQALSDYNTSVPKSNAVEFTADGNYKVCVRLRDNGGNLPAYGASATIVRKTSVPTFISIGLANQAGDGMVNAAERIASGDLVGALAGVNYETVGYRLVSVGSTCDGSLTYTGSIPKVNSSDFGSDGTYKVCVRLADNAGNPPAFGTSGTITLDTTVPSLTAAPLANDVADGFINASEAVQTNALLGTLVAAGYSSLGYKLVPSATACDGNLSYGSDVPKSNSIEFGSSGSYKICLRLDDAAGNVTYGSSATFALDTSEPYFTSINLASSVADGYLNADERSLTNGLVGGLVATGHDMISYVVVPATTNCSSSLSYTPLIRRNNTSEITTDRSYKVCIKLSDYAGNNSDYGSSAVFVVDTTAPTFTSIDLGPALADNYLNASENLITSDLAANLVGSGFDTSTYQLVSAGTTCTESLVYSSTVPKSNSSAFTGDGSYKICVRLSDAAGNTPAVGQSSTFTLARTLPGSFSIIDPPTATNISMPAVTWSAAARAVSYDLKIDDTLGCPSALQSQNGLTTTTWTLNALPAGTYFICLTARDVAGNTTVADNNSYAFVINLTPPGPFLITSPAAATSATSPIIVWGASAGATTYDVAIGTNAQCSSPIQSYAGLTTTSTVIAATLSDGSYRICITARDSAGNQTQASNNGYTFVVDTVQPGQFTILEPSGSTTRRTPTVVWNAAPGATRYTIDVATDSGCTATVQSYAAVTGTAKVLDQLDPGTYYLCMVAQDNVPNSMTALNSGLSFTVISSGWISQSPLNGSSPTERDTATMVWTGTTGVATTQNRLIVFGGYNGSAYLNTGGIYEPTTGLWVDLPTTSVPSVRRYHTAVWTGDTGVAATKNRMLVWGGWNGTAALGDGAIYDSATNTWTTISSTNAPSIRYGHAAVWTGSKMIIWGGFSGSSHLNTGAIYDLATNTWTTVQSTNAPAIRRDISAVWTGSQMIIWGGFNGTAYLNTGGVYDLAANTWTATQATGAPSIRSSASAVWTGSTMLIFGGYNGAAVAGGASYNPSGTGTWTALTTTNAPSARWLHSAHLAEGKMIIWGGATAASTGTNTGAVYDVTAGTWTAMSTSSAPVARLSHTAAWSGSMLYVINGSSGTTYLTDGAAYSLTGNSWASINTAPAARSAAQIFWTGATGNTASQYRMVVWGGGAATGRADGGIFDPSTGLWTPMATAGAKTGYPDSTAAWNGTFLFVYGGSTTGTCSLNETTTGGLYSVSDNIWTATVATGNPGGTQYASSVAAGAKFITWGGRYSSSAGVCAYRNTGAIYDISTSTWNATSTTNAPGARFRHCAAWTGTRMIIWGGNNGANLNTGGIYDPVTDTWIATSTTGAPSARSEHSCTWTGTKLIVWGGYDGANYLDTGGIFDPIANTWTIMNWGDAPVIRSKHSAVWTGTQLLLYGGDNTLAGAINSGAIYDPSNDSWVATSTTGAPTGRYLHGAVWTGNTGNVGTERRMLIWGGTNSTLNLNNGGIYSPP
jgi:hypothetical protein